VAGRGISDASHNRCETCFVQREVYLFVCLFVLAVLEFDLRALHSVGRCSTIWVIPPNPKLPPPFFVCFSYFSSMVSHFFPLMLASNQDCPSYILPCSWCAHCHSRHIVKIESYQLFAQAVFKPQSFWSLPLSSWDYRPEPLNLAYLFVLQC
jgi:hypothetical protein